MEKKLKEKKITTDNREWRRYLEKPRRIKRWRKRCDINYDFFGLSVFNFPLMNIIC